MGKCDYSGQANYATAKVKPPSFLASDGKVADTGGVKMGIIGLTKTIAKEWGPQFGVRANTVAFGTVVLSPLEYFFSIIAINSRN